MNFNASQIRGELWVNFKGWGGKWGGIIRPKFFVHKAYKLSVHYQKSMTINNTLFPSPFKAIAFFQRKRMTFML